MDNNKYNDSSKVNKEWLTTTDVAEYLNINRASLYRIIKSDENFPKGYSIIGKSKEALEKART